MMRARLLSSLVAVVPSLLLACGDDSDATGSSSGGASSASSSTSGTEATSVSSSGAGGSGSTASSSGAGAGGSAPVGCEQREGSVGTWTPVSQAGAPTELASSLVWNGREVLIVDTFGGRMHAYDPAADSWRTLPSLPAGVAGRSFAYLAWLEDELFLWGGKDSEGAQIASGAILDIETGDSRAVATAGAADLEGSYFARGGPALFRASPGSVTMVSTGTDGADWIGTYLPGDESWTGVVPAQADPILYACEQYAFHPAGDSIACGSQGDVALFSFSPFAYTPLPQVPSTNFTSEYAFGWQGSRLVAYARHENGADGLLIAIEPGDPEWAVLGSHPGRTNPAYGMVGESLVVWGGANDQRWSDGVVVPPDGAPAPTTCDGAPPAAAQLSTSIGDGLFVFDPVAQVGGVFRL